MTVKCLNLFTFFHLELVWLVFCWSCSYTVLNINKWMNQSLILYSNGCHQVYPAAWYLILICLFLCVVLFVLTFLCLFMIMPGLFRQVALGSDIIFIWLSNTLSMSCRLECIYIYMTAHWPILIWLFIRNAMYVWSVMWCMQYWISLPWCKIMIGDWSYGWHNLPLA